MILAPAFVLHRFPFDKIKIDRSFIRDIEGPKDSSAIVQALVHVALTLGIWKKGSSAV
jgi:EAL domain-containing protein (putative c-di-GMP-specific phosphodiesterase class I)